MDTRDKINDLWEMDWFFMSHNELVAYAKVGYQVAMERKGHDYINNLYNQRFNGSSEGKED